MRPPARVLDATRVCAVWNSEDVVGGGGTRVAPVSGEVHIVDDNYKKRKSANL